MSPCSEMIIFCCSIQFVVFCSFGCSAPRGVFYHPLWQWSVCLVSSPESYCAFVVTTITAPLIFTQLSLAVKTWPSASSWWFGDFIHEKIYQGVQNHSGGSVQSHLAWVLFFKIWKILDPPTRAVWLSHNSQQISDSITPYCDVKHSW